MNRVANKIFKSAQKFEFQKTLLKTLQKNKTCLWKLEINNNNNN